MKRSDQAISYFKQPYNCAQSVFSAFSEEFGMSEQLARSAACGFGGGFGELQKTCGAVTGAIMVIGCKYFDKNNCPDSKRMVYKKTRDFMEKFKERNSSTNCLELTGVNFNAGKGIMTAGDKELLREKCEKYVRDACEILEGIL